MKTAKEKKACVGVQKTAHLKGKEGGGRRGRYGWDSLVEMKTEEVCWSREGILRDYYVDGAGLYLFRKNRARGASRRADSDDVLRMFHFPQELNRRYNIKPFSREV